MEFKRLSDVEVVAEPTESANVLIEENGVIKKTPKTAVGGAGGAGGLIIVFNPENWTGESCEILSMPDNLYESIYNAFFVDMTGINITLCKYYADNNNFECMQMSYIYREDDQDGIYIQFWNSAWYIYCYSDGRVIVYEAD